MTDDAKKKLRLVLLVVVVVALFTTGFVLQRRGELHPHDLAEKVRAFGVWALPTFFAMCVVAELLHVPGMLFVIVAQLVFGRFLGFFAGYFGSILAMSVAFGIARSFRGKGDAAPPKLRWAWANRALAQLETKPILTIVLLRTVFWVSPPLNYALGWSNVKTRDYLLGSALGLFVPIALWSWIVETYGTRALHWLG